MKEVKALILCGGFGKRLRPLTETTPKPLLEIRSDFTILDKQILELQKADIKTVFLLIGYLGEKIKQRYGDNWKGVQINYCEEDKPLGTLGGLRRDFNRLIVMSLSVMVILFLILMFLHLLKRLNFLPVF